MELAEARTLADLRSADSMIAAELAGKSLDFFEPPSTDVHWEVERKPFQPNVLVLLPTQPVSRAWDFLFRFVLNHIAPLGWAPAPYILPPQLGPPIIGARALAIELPDEDREESKRAVAAINAATDVANAVTATAATECRREHEELARELGLTRPEFGFGASTS